MDLFDFSTAIPAPKRAAAPPSDPGALSSLPVRPIAWQRLLARAPAARVLLFVSQDWTGVCLEVLSDPQLGRRWLHQDGGIHEFPPSGAYGRTIYLREEQIAPIAAKGVLMPRGPGGTKAVLYELAGLHP